MDPHRDYDDCEDGHDDGGDGHDEEQRTKEQPIAADEGSGADTTIREPADETPIAKADPVISLTKMFCLADKWDICMMILGFAGAIIKGVTVPLMFYLFGSVLEAYGNNKTDRVAMASEIFRVAVYYLYLGLTSVVAGFFETACFIYSAQRQSTRLRRKYLEAILIQEVGYFDTEANTAAIIDCITEKIIDYQDATGEKIGHFFFNVTTAVGSVGLAFFLCWQLALLTFLVLPSVTMTGGFYTLVLANLARKSQFAYQNADSIVYETVSNIRTVYSYVGEMKANKDFSDALVDTVKLGSRAGMAKGVGLGMLNGTMNASWGMMFWIGAILVSKGQADRTGVIISIFCIIYGGLCLGLAVPDIEAMGKGRRAAYPIFEIIERVPKVKDGTKPRNLARVHGKIELQNVHFFYPSRPEAPIFTGLSLTVPAGKAVALVGSSGSGKSTIISLISRFFDPLKGKILVDGHDITQVSIHSLRSNIGLVGQEPALFTTTIHENILMGRPNATDDEVEAAAKVANIHSFISKLPNGYATQVGDRGTQLSGGQKQRIAIARAVLKDPAILLLDEATSALDAESERVIQDALDVLMLARTSVTVAHKLSTIQNVDHIAVLECGELREWGSHNELMLKGPSGAYFNLHQCQDAKRSEDIEKFTPPQQQQTTPRPSLTRSNSGNRGLMLLAGGDSSASFVALDFPTTPTGQSMSDEIRRHSDFLTPRSSVSFSNKADAYLGPNFTQDILKAATALEAAAARDSTLTRLYKLALTEWKRIVLGCLGSVSAGCVKPVFSILMVQAATSLYKREDQVQDAVSKWAIILACLAVYSVITSSIEHAFFGQAGERITKSVRERVFYSVLRNEVGWFDLEDNSSAHITGRLATDAASINTAIAKQLSSAVNNISSVLFAIGVGFVYDWKMTLVSIALLPCWLISGVVRYKSTLGYAHVLRTAHESASSFAVQAVTNIRTVASFTLETRIIDTLNQVLQEPLRNGRKHAIETGSANGGGFALSQLGNGLSLFYLTAAIRTDNADFIALFTVFQVMCNTAAFLSELLAIIPQFARVRDGVNSVFEVMDRSTEIDPDKAGSKRPDSGLVGKIQFRGVHFRYPLRPDVPVLRDLSLKIEAGEYFALVGESGSGKSSCIALIERFYDVSAGLVLIDGVDVRDYNLSWLREQIGLVQQEPYLLRCSVRENIAYGGHYSEAQVIQAAKAANAHTFISALPQGYDTDVGDRGSLLSGGQKQRVAIARAVLKNPRILLLDEATSALDANSERIVQNALDCLMVGKTTLVIAHRLSTIRHANTIVVMKAGRAVEQGNHDKLMLITSGHYANLVASQDHQREGDRV